MQEPMSITLSPIVIPPIILFALLCLSGDVSRGRVQSEALWPIRQLHGRALPLSFSFFVCLCNLSSVCIQVESLELTPRGAGYTYLLSQNLQTSS